jgi:hypothetical protein
LKLAIDGSWSGLDGDTIVQFTDGSVWRQDEYRYAYRPDVVVVGDRMTVQGMSQSVQVRRLS